MKRSLPIIGLGGQHAKMFKYINCILQSLSYSFAHSLRISSLNGFNGIQIIQMLHFAINRANRHFRVFAIHISCISTHEAPRV